MSPAGVVFDIKRFAIHDGPGIRTTVFLKGCPLGCAWCHNPESRRVDPELSFRAGRCIACGHCAEACEHDAITVPNAGPVTDAKRCVLCGACAEGCPSGARELVGRSMSVAEVVEVAVRDRVFYESSGGGVTFSGGEPLAQPAFLVAALRACRAAGLHTAVDTTCHADPAVVDAVAEHADLMLVDVKHMDARAHEAFTGVGNTLIQANIRRLAEAGHPLIVRVPMVSGVNDDAATVRATAGFVASLGVVRRVDLLPYVEGGPVKSERLIQPTPTEAFAPPDGARLAEAVARYEACGLTVTIGG